MAFLARARALLACALLWLGVCSQPAYSQGDTIEVDVKAAFLYNFTKYVDWPAAAFQDDSDPFRMCVVARPEFVTAVENFVRGETARARQIEVVTPLPSQVNRCHILFIGAQEAQRFGPMLLQTIAARPTLTVVESQALFDQGSTILLVVDQSRVRFDINLASAHKAGLAVSSKLLRVARNIRDEVPGR